MTNNKAATILATKLDNGVLGLNDLPAKARGPVLRALANLRKDFKPSFRKPAKRLDPDHIKTSTLIRQWVTESRQERIEARKHRRA